MCELCLDSREEGSACKRPIHVSIPAAGGGEAFKRTKAPRPRGGGGGRSRRVYGSHHQNMQASLLSEQVTSSSSYLSFLSMQQHPTQPAIETSQKMMHGDGLDLLGTLWPGRSRRYTPPTGAGRAGSSCNRSARCGAASSRVP